jgi:hypothetical protein
VAALLPLLFLQDFFSDFSHQGRDGTVIFQNEGQVDWKVPVFDQYGEKRGNVRSFD